ncbi:hypothetical protein [Catellatospora sp. NPDC049609]|uniref:hypothetical protein n=1 Tax=Catellatospora sp. NPDC049609 TaxID=3155505 RepID=UPI003438F674
MGNSHMYPVLRTTDLDAAFALVDRLLPIANEIEYLDLWAVTGSHDLSRYAALPQARYSAVAPAELADAVLDGLGDLITEPHHVHHRARGSELVIDRLDARAAQLLRELPAFRLDVDVDRAPPGTVERSYRDAVGQDVGGIYWKVTWPPIEDLTPYGCVKYGGLEITVNSAGLFDETYTGDHTVWVHTREDWRARWLAEQAGAEVVGEMRSGR